MHVDIHIDNDTVIKRLKTGVPSDGSITAFVATDYDLWLESMQVLENLSCKVNFCHVKGHQDNFCVKQNKEGSLNKHVFWNIAMDKLAGIE